MEPLTHGDVEHISELAYVKLSDEEMENMRVHLTDILGHFASLSTVDTDDVEVTGHTTDAYSVMRKDEPFTPMDQEDVLRNAPDRDGEFLRVRPVFE